MVGKDGISGIEGIAQAPEYDEKKIQNVRTNICSRNFREDKTELFLTIASSFMLTNESGI